MLAFVVFLSFTGRPIGGRLVEVAVERTNSRGWKVDKGPRIHDTWEPSINSTYGAPLLFQAKTRGDARFCHAHASYFIGKCANTILNPSPLLVLLPLLSFLSFFFLGQFFQSRSHHFQVNGK